MLVLEFQRDQLVRSDQMLIDIVNVVVLVVFSVDYLLGLAAAERRLTYVRTEWLELLLVFSQALVLFPTLAAFGILRAMRATRIIRVAVVITRVVAIGGIASREGRRALRERAFSFALGLAGLTCLTSAVAFTMVEDVGVDGRIPSFYDGLWWSLSTVTTVGYGDIAPVTAAGRIVGAITMLVGISVFAIITARIAEFFLASETTDQSA